MRRSSASPAKRCSRRLQDVEAISRHALAHAAVIEFFFRRAPVIPLKLFTLFSSDEKARAHVRGRLAPLRRMFAALRGLEEWGVRVIAGEVEAESARTLESGRDYLQVKKRLHEQTSRRRARRCAPRTARCRSLGRLASKTRKEAFPPPGRGRPYVDRRVVSRHGEAARRRGRSRRQARDGARREDTGSK